MEVAEIIRDAGHYWELLVIPTLGGLFAGLVLFWGLRLVGPQGSSNLLEVVVAGDGRLPLRSAIVKFISSLITIGSGGSIGREGGIVQLSATFASKWGQFAKWPPYRSAFAGRLRRGLRHFRRLQCADLRRGIRGADRASETFR